MSKSMKSYNSLQRTQEMSMSHDHPISKCSIGCLLFFSILAMAASVTLVTLLAIWGYIGFIGSPPFTASACTDTYYTTKYSDMTIFNEVVFAGSSLSAIMSLLMFFITLSWVCKICKGPFSPSNCERGFIFFVASLTVLGSIPSSGYYLNLLIQNSNCTFNMDQTQILLILILAGSALILGLLAWLITFCQNCCRQQDREEIYKQVDTTIKTQQTQNPRRKQDPKKYSQYKDERYIRKSPQKIRQQYQPPSRTQKYEFTKQKLEINRDDIYDSPSKRRIESYNNRNNLEPIYLEDKFKREDPIPLRDDLLGPRFNKNAYNQQESVVKNLHPSLRDVNPRDYVQKNKRNNDYLGDDLQYLRRQQGRYFNDMDRRGVLPRVRGDMEQRQRRNDRDRYDRDEIRNRQDRYRQDRNRLDRQDRYDRNYSQNRADRNDNEVSKYLRPYDPPRRHQSPPYRGQRQGVLNNYIRGRYAY